MHILPFVTSSSYPFLRTGFRAPLTDCRGPKTMTGPADFPARAGNLAGVQGIPRFGPTPLRQSYGQPETPLDAVVADLAVVGQVETLLLLVHLDAQAEGAIHDL